MLREFIIIVILVVLAGCTGGDFGTDENEAMETTHPNPLVISSEYNKSVNITIELYDSDGVYNKTDFTLHYPHERRKDIERNGDEVVSARVIINDEIIFNETIKESESYLIRIDDNGEIKILRSVI